MGGRAAVCINENAGTAPINLRPSPLYQKHINKISFYSHLSVDGKKGLQNFPFGRRTELKHRMNWHFEKNKGNFGLALTDTVRGSCWPADQEQMIQAHVQNYSSF